MMAVRDGPMTPTARVNRIWLIPGAKSPVTKNGQVSCQATSAEVTGDERERRADDAGDDRRDERRGLCVDAAGEREIGS